MRICIISMVVRDGGETPVSTLTAAFQLVPEQSTAAIVVHHPQATYFSIGGSTRERANVDVAEVAG